MTLEKKEINLIKKLSKMKITTIMLILKVSEIVMNWQMGKKAIRRLQHLPVMDNQELFMKIQMPQETSGENVMTLLN